MMIIVVTMSPDMTEDEEKSEARRLADELSVGVQYWSPNRGHTYLVTDKQLEKKVD